jgi:tetratricopeptide (TPR) repeat protein
MEFPSMLDWTERAHAAAQAVGDRAALVSTTGAVAFAHELCGEVPAAHRMLDEAIALIGGLTDEELVLCLEYGGGNVAATALDLGRVREAGAVIERMLSAARARGRGSIVPMLFWTGLIRSALGRLDDAAEVLDTAIEIARLHGHASNLGWTLFGRSIVATAAADVETALACAEESGEVLAELDRSLPAAWSALALAAALLPAGEPARAVDAVRHAADGDELPRFPAPWRAEGFELLARGALALGREEEAARAVARAREWAERLGLAPWRARAPSAPPPRSRCTGATPAPRRPTRAPPRPRPTRPAPPSRARRHGCWRAARSPRQGARRRRPRSSWPRRPPSTPPERCAGATRPSASCAGSGTGASTGAPGRARPTATAWPPSPSASCRSRGWSWTARRTRRSRELFLSRKTVETHMSNLFQKLRVSSRVEVARAVERADRRAGELAAGASGTA